MNERMARKPDQVLLALVGILVSFGLVMVYSSSFAVAFTDYGSQTYWVVRQSMWAVLGVIGMLVAMRFDYRYLRGFSVPLMLGTIFMLVLVLILPDSITNVNGASRWIILGSVNIQPSEFAKFAAVVYFADWLSRRGSKVRMFMTGLLPFSIMLGVLAGLVLVEPDMGTTIVLVLIGAMILFSSGASLLHLSVASVITVMAGWMAVQSAGYRLQRVLVWQDPWQFAREGGYQPIHSLYALGSGGWTGVGLGQSRQKFHWLPFAHTDAIFAVIGEELGLLMTVLVILAFVLLAVRGLRIAAQSQDRFGALIAVGLTSWLVFQALVNMAVVSTLIPFTGITLPFISYGGSSLTMTMVAAGLLLSVSRYAPLHAAEEQTHVAARTFSPHVAAADVVRWWHRRSRISGARRSRGPAQPDLPPSLTIGTAISGSWRRGNRQRPAGGSFWSFLRRHAAGRHKRIAGRSLNERSKRTPRR